MLTCACGICGAGGVAGAVGADNPGMAGRPGIDEAAGTPGDAAAGCAPVRPWIIPGMPVAAGDGAGAAGVADCASPGMEGNAAGDDAGAAGVAAGVSPGIDGMPATDAGDAGEAAAGTPGKLMPGVAGAAGGVAPSAVARFCRI